MARDKRRAELEKFAAQCGELPAPPGSPAEQVIWLVLARHGSKDGAERAFRSLWRRFVDVNEFRVAKATEIASLIGRAVRGDAIRVAEESRGFLRRFHKDHHTIDFTVTETMTLDQLRKYMASLPDSARELGLALFLHYCRRAKAAEAEEVLGQTAEVKPKKRAEKDLAILADRLRLASAIAAKGEVVSKAREAAASKGLVAAWEPGSAPEALPFETAPEPEPEEAPEPPPPPEERAEPEAADGSGAAAHGGKGAPRPHTTRETKARQDKRSSRR